MKKIILSIIFFLINYNFYCQDIPKSYELVDSITIASNDLHKIKRIHLTQNLKFLILETWNEKYKTFVRVYNFKNLKKLIGPFQTGKWNVDVYSDKDSKKIYFSEMKNTTVLNTESFIIEKTTLKWNERENLVKAYISSEDIFNKEQIVINDIILKSEKNKLKIYKLKSTKSELSIIDSNVQSTKKYDKFLNTGKYYALLIGVDKYNDDNINDLDQPIKDATELYSILSNNYTFDKNNIIQISNPTKKELIKELDDLASKSTKYDNLLIFYAGHGYWDESFEQGYWLPSDAEKDMRGTWISNAIIRDYMKGIPSRHSLLITDACFGGGIFKTRSAFRTNKLAVQELYKTPSKKAMTSGTLKEVPDKSIFIKYLCQELLKNEEIYLSSEDLFYRFKTTVINNSPNNQIPQFGEIQNTGDEGGDFIFIKK